MNDSREISENGRPTTIVDALAALQTKAPDKTALTVLPDGEVVGARATYAEIYQAADTIARVLRRKYPPMTRVLLALPNGLEFVHAFFGCLAAGMIAVPCNIPPPSKRRNPWQRLQAIAQDSRAELIFATAKIADRLCGARESDGLFHRCDIVDPAAPDALEGARADRDTAPGTPRPRANDVAFLQYTSGTTAAPKGVAITHANIMNNQKVIERMMGHHPDIVVVSWLPLYHDMGLSALLQMASVGARLVLMPPVAFIQKPLRWLKAISDYKAHTSGGPNFAYDLVAAELRAAEVDALDLASWQVAFCGAEPIRDKTVAEFVRLAAPLGFKPSAFYPCYGLAEATLAVTGVKKGGGVTALALDADLFARGVVQPAPNGGAGARRLIGCGSPRAGNQVRIVDPTTRRPCADDEIGEVWVRGKSVGAGYWNNPQATQETFRAYVADGDGPYLRTGDLGMLHRKQLYITGRAKDLIIIRGRNLYPQDIEEVVQHSADGLKKDGGAAFTVAAGDEEKLVVVQEITRALLRTLNAEGVLETIVAAVFDEFGVAPHAVVLVSPATMPKTSSGKVQRSLCRTYYLEGGLQVVAAWSSQPATNAGSDRARDGEPRAPGIAAAAQARYIADKIAQTVAGYLRVDVGQIGTATPWAELGLDSVHAVRLVQTLQDTLGIKLESTVLWECANIEELAARIAGESSAGVRRDAPARRTSEGAADPTRGAGAPKAPAVRSAQDILQLSEAEATALLREELER